MYFKEIGCEFAQWIFCSRSGPVVELFKHNYEFIYPKFFQQHAIHNDFKNFLKTNTTLQHVSVGSHHRRHHHH